MTTPATGRSTPTTAAGAARTILDVFASQVARDPNATAIQHGMSALTFAELDRRSTAAARRLVGHGVGPESLVGLLVERDPDMAIGVLAILKAGGAFVPLDPAYPRARLAWMAADSGMGLVVTGSGRSGPPPLDGVREVPLDGDTTGGTGGTGGNGGGTEPADRPEPVSPAGRTDPRSAAYLIYTSGSTGTPKGVVVEHRNLLAVFTAWDRLHGLCAAPPRLLSVTSLSVDLFLADLLRSVFAGGSLVIAPQDAVTDPGRLLDLLETTGADAIELVPSLAKALGREAAARGRTLPTLRLLSVGSEGWLTEDCRELLPLLGPGTRVVNAYGATETTMDSCLFPPTAGPGLSTSTYVPIGHPLPGTTVYVLDAALHPVPDGTTGELWIGGLGVARGYHGRPRITAERFVPDPWTPGGRLYRTGDLARRRPDGELEFLGRSDDQVKIRGFRVETGEVEGTLVRHPSVAAAAVIAHRSADHTRLVAYVVPSGPRPLDTEILRAFLAERLPAPARPAVLVALDRLPTLPNGKVDRRALPAPPRPTSPGASGRAPAPGAERTLAEIWSDVLGVDGVGADEDFFALGGDSVLALRAAARARAALHTDLTLRDLFEHRTVAALIRNVPPGQGAPAAPRMNPSATSGGHPRRAPEAGPGPAADPASTVSGGSAADPASTVSGGSAAEPASTVPGASDPAPAPTVRGSAPSGRRELPLTPLQRRLWFQHHYAPSAEYAVGGALRLTGPLDTRALERALTLLVARHDALRTTFEAMGEDDDGRRIVHPPAPVAFDRTDLTAVPADARNRALDQLLAGDLRRPFALDAAPPLRPRLIRLAPDDHVVSLTTHHLITDDWSYEVLMADLGAFYTAATTGTTARLSALPTPYGDGGEPHPPGRDAERERIQLDHWREHLAGLSPKELPLDRPRRPDTGSTGAVVRTTVPRPVTERLRDLGRTHRGTLFTTLLAACQVLLARHTGQHDTAVGTVLAGRDDPDTDDLVGFLVNTVVIRTRVDETRPFTDLVDQVRDTLLDAVTHGALPFDRVVEALAPERHADRTPWIPAMVVMRNTPSRARRFASLTVSEVEVPVVAVPFDLTVEFQEDAAGGMRADFLYNAEVFDRETVEALARRLCVLLAGIAADPGARTARLPLLTAEEHRALTAHASGGPAADHDRTIHEVFADQARRDPRRTAVISGDQRLDYGELDARADRLAHHLTARGVGPEALIGLCLDRGPELIVALLAVLKAGGAFLPLDTGQPAGRLAEIVVDSGTRLVLTERHHLPLLERLPADVARLALPADRALVDRHPATGPAVPVRPENLAYAVYTSGSTGRPKGVLVPHAGVCNLAADSRGSLGLEPGARMLQHLPLAFDGGIWQVLMPLLNGATLCISQPGDDAPDRLAARVGRDGVTIMMLTPALLAALDPAALPELDLVCAGADVCPVPMARAWQAVAPFANAYGPTETTMATTVHRLPRPGPPPAGPRVPIGTPVRGSVCYVLDASLRPLPAGVPGELYIGGAGVARGYRGRPAATAERFLPDPWGPPGSRMYRTGDLARRHRDGTLDFLGRVDGQVKIGGYRVETGEVTAALATHPDVAEAVVTARTPAADPDAPPRLVAHLVPRPGRTIPPAPRLRGHLGGLLPAYMVPSHFVVLDAFPLNRSGKVDVRALPAPPRMTAGHGPRTGPESGVEGVLADVWAAVLGIERVGADEDFFSLGGDSINTLRLVARAREVGLSLTPKDVFTHPTVRALAQALASRRTDSVPPVPGEAGPRAPAGGSGADVPWGDIPRAGAAPAVVPGGPADAPRPGSVPGPADAPRGGPVPGTASAPEPGDASIPGSVPIPASTPRPGPEPETYPLTPLQQGLLFHTLAAGQGQDPYARRVTLTLTGITAPRVLARAWRYVVARTPALRSGVELRGAAPAVQRVRPFADVPITHHDWRTLPARHRRARWDRLVEETADTLPDPCREVPMRLAVVRVTDTEVRLLWDCHHLFLDGWSLTEVIADVLRAHAALARGRAPELPERGPFSEYVDWLAGRDQEPARAYWRSALAGFTGPTPLPLADAPPTGHRVRHSAVRTTLLTPDAERRLRAFARRGGLTLNTLVQAAWALLLARHTGTDDVVFGGTVAHRGTEPPGAPSMIGLLVNTLPVRVRVDDRATVLDWLRALQREQAEARQYDTLPLAEQHRHTALPPGTRLFHTAVALDNVPDVPDVPDATAADVPRLTGLRTENATENPLTLFVHTADGFALDLRYDRDLYTTDTARGLSDRLRRLLDALTADPARRVGTLTVADHPAGVGSPTPTARRLHDLFAEQAARTPDAPAVEAAGRILDYTELDGRANRLAHHLISRGVGPETVVGVALPRGADQVIALLGVVKAGGVHLPLDRAHPADRLAGMLADADAALLLTDAVDGAPWCPAGIPVLALDHDAASLARLPGTAPPSRTRPENAAYMVYTSGSTGAPKGTVVTHRGITGMVAAARGAGVGPGHRVLRFASVGFDAAVWEVVPTLCSGATLVVVPEDELRAGAVLARTVTRHGITHLTLPPAVLAAQPVDSLPAGRVLVSAGDRLPAWLAARWATHHRLFNGYGPTESTVCATVSERLTAGDGTEDPSIGTPIPGTGVLVLDAGLRPVPDGVPGELYLTGIGLARGYRGRAGLTAERFPACPYGPPGRRMYRTGDLVRRLPGGALLFLGRADQQLKVRGFRIEPGEIEAELADHPEVERAVVVAVGEAQRRRLVAHVVPAGTHTPAPAALREHLDRRLPAHMVPVMYVRHRALPLTDRGKVDRRALERAAVTAHGAPPAGDGAARAGAERTMAGLWAWLLDRDADRIGRREKFFEAGGTSLTLLQLVGRMTELGVADVSVATLLEHSTLAEMARLLDHTSGSVPRSGDGTAVPRSDDGTAGAGAPGRPLPEPSYSAGSADSTDTPDSPDTENDYAL
ncbi:amino acid adenylation domain-containing protein [Streptomyces sp. NPDC057638]|uniref:non-ribosomal peptide synthetase n=1 Tax=Streptomyces sp. NPDC057638 TaxID=3346190 RepID=UPI0036AD40DD